MAINAELLRKIVAFAEEEPRRLVMETYYEDVGEVLRRDFPLEYLDIVELEVAKTVEDLAPCGTACCIAGAACIVSGKALHNGKWYQQPFESWWTTAYKILGLTSEEQAQRLFYPYAGFSNRVGDGYWPEPFGEEYKAVRSDPAKRVAVLKRRVEHFIQTDGRE